MAQEPRRPRVRKTAPSKIEEQVEAKPVVSVRRKRSPIGNLLQPIAPVGRAIKKVFGWLLPRYFVNSWRELRSVTWPSRRETWRLTLAVFVFAAVFGAVVYGVDKELDEIFKKTVLKQ